MSREANRHLKKKEGQAIEKLKEACGIFDREHRGIISVDDLPSIIRYLGRFPSERDMKDNIIAKMKLDPGGVTVAFESVQEILVPILLGSEYLPDPDFILLKAFRTVDRNNDGYLTQSRLEQLLTAGGEAFSAAEVEQFLAVATDKKSGYIYYDDYIAQVQEDVQG